MIIMKLEFDDFVHKFKIGSFIKEDYELIISELIDVCYQYESDIARLYRCQFNALDMMQDLENDLSFYEEENNNLKKGINDTRTYIEDIKLLLKDKHIS